jgi:hypothetical protein
MSIDFILFFFPTYFLLALSIQMPWLEFDDKDHHFHWNKEHLSPHTPPPPLVLDWRCFVFSALCMITTRLFIAGPKSV